ncbi:Putative Glucosamine 6-phosphate N-acetyltransferase [[Torrubiella] hemipterigena]|nr:Putative Glucosamine 6-phosphate N-acetyltransferase [[Torrubiella] hemipterigena]
MFDLINSFAQYFYPIASAVSTSPAIGASSPATNANGDTMQQQDQETGLFGLDLVSPEVAAQLPPGYRFRALRRSDYNSGFLDCLRVLTTVGEITEEDFQKQYDAMDEQEGYYIMVIEDTARKEHAVVATGALMVERKFIHSLGRVGHIEDIAVAKDQQGKKLGLRMIQALDYVAKNVGCYKTILDCSETNEGFYIKCGFRRAGLEMAHYHNKG